MMYDVMLCGMMWWYDAKNDAMAEAIVDEVVTKLLTEAAKKVLKEEEYLL